MATVSRSRRSAAGIAFIVAGALFVLVVLLPVLGIAAPWLTLLAYAAMAVGLGILGFGAVNNRVAQIALIASAVGWLILLLAGLAVGLPAGLVTFGAVLAMLGFLIGAIVMYVGKEIANVPAMFFIAAAVLAVLYLLPLMGAGAFGAVASVVTVLLGIALIVTGVYFGREGRNRS